MHTEEIAERVFSAPGAREDVRRWSEMLAEDRDPMVPDWLKLARDAEYEHPRMDAEGAAVQ